jgi:hypothetical protein
MTERRVEPGEQHPEEWRADLNPEGMAGVNHGQMGARSEQDAPTAADIDELHQRLEGFTSDELQQIPVLAAGTRLKQGATYIDLRDNQPEEFTATAEMSAGTDNWYVPKSEVGYQLWNRLIGVQQPERRGEGDAS